MAAARRPAHRRDRAGLGQVRRRCRADGRLGPGPRDGLHVPHGRPVAARLGRDRGRRGPRGEPAHRRPHQRRDDLAARARHRAARRERLGHRPRARPLRQRPDRPRRARRGGRGRRAGPGDPRQRRAVRDRGRAARDPAAHGPPGVPGWASRPRRSSAWRPATRPASTASTSACSRPAGRRTCASSMRPSARSPTRRSGPWPTATCSGSRWSSSTASPLIGRSRNTAPAARAAEVVKGPAVGGGGH